MSKIVKQAVIFVGGLAATIVTAKLAGTGAAYYMGLLGEDDD